MSRRGDLMKIFLVILFTTGKRSVSGPSVNVGYIGAYAQNTFRAS